MNEGPLEKFGRVREVKNWDTKKIDDYKFEGEGVEQTSDKLAALGPMVATINLQNARHSDDPNALHFIAKSKWFRDITDVNLNALIIKMEDAFRKAYIEQLGLEWSDWIEVTVSGNADRMKDKWEDGGRDGEPNSAHLSVQYDIVKRGRAKGKDFIVDEHGRLSTWPKPKAAGADREGKGAIFLGRHREGHYQETEKQYSYIEATPENLAAVKSVISRIEDVEQRLQDVLNQKGIKLALATTWRDMPSLEHKS